MKNNIKSGHEILHSFFPTLKDLKVSDKETINVLVKLFNEEKLSSTNLYNELEALRIKTTK